MCTHSSPPPTTSTAESCHRAVGGGRFPWEQSKTPASTTVGNPGAQSSCSPAEAQQGKVQRPHGAAAAGWAGEVRLRAGVGTCAVAQAAARQLAEGTASEIAGDCGWCGKVGPQLGNEQHPNWWGAWQRVPVVGERPRIAVAVNHHTCGGHANIDVVIVSACSDSAVTSLITERRWALQQTQLVLVCNPHPH